MTDTAAEFSATPPVAGDEAAVLLGTLERMRALLQWKCGDLDAAGLAATLGPSTISLGGLLKHLACVEDTHFARLLLDQLPGAPWDAVDWENDPDWEWRTAADDSPGELLALWRDAVGRARLLVGQALADGGLDHVGSFVNRRGESPNLRYILMTMVEEYARHLGHADLIRESVDGLVGEDPPQD